MSYKYLAEFNIVVRRTDNQPLTPEEDAMVEDMRRATKEAIAGVMLNHGQGIKKDLGSKTVKF